VTTTAETATPAKVRKVSFADATRGALAAALELDDSVFLLGEDIADQEGGGTFKVTKGLSTRFGVHRVRTTPISEQAIIGAAIGAAIVGMRPVAEIMLMNFMTVAMDQITNHAAKLRYMSGGQTTVPITIRTATGAGLGTGAQHSDMLEAWFAHTPGLKVVMASTPAEQAGLLTSCIFDDDPCIVIEKKERYSVRGPEPADYATRIPLGVANVVRPGSDVTVIGYGGAVADSLAVAEELAADGVSVEVVDLRTIAPWDERTVLESVARTKRAVVVHEAVGPFGTGAEISSRIHEELFGELSGPVARVASRPTPVPFARSLEGAYLYSQAGIAGAIRTLTGG
jgi:acetoin:2,6-dichlorophenolindophenol oxidoreductase subunit beta